MRAEGENTRPSRIATSQGIVHFRLPRVDEMQRLSELLPLGLRVAVGDGDCLRYGLVMSSGSEELRFLKQLPPDVIETQAPVVMRANQILIASSLAQYLTNEASGLFWPISYMRKRPQGVETGIAYAGWGFDSHSVGADPITTSFDRDFSAGFTRAMTSFVEIIKAESQVSGISLQPCIGLDVRNCSLLGQLSFDFLVLDQEVFCLKSEISEQDPTWTLLRSSGIDTLIHIPSWPLDL